MTHLGFNLITPPGGLCMQVCIYQWFDQFSVFSCFRSSNSNFFAWEPIDIQNLLTFLDFEHRLGYFFIFDSPKTIKNEGSRNTSEEGSSVQIFIL